MDSIEGQAYIEGGIEAHAYAKSIGKTDLATFTALEYLIFCECMCKAYTLKHAELHDFIPY